MTEHLTVRTVGTTVLLLAVLGLRNIRRYGKHDTRVKPSYQTGYREGAARLSSSRWRQEG
eukprot:7375323-Pyramimonas_sp.AAC.2